MVQLICSTKEMFSFNEWIFNLPELELQHIQTYDFIRVDRLLSNFPSDNINITLNKLMETIYNTFWEDFVGQELVEVNKRLARVLLDKLFRGGNLEFIDGCMDSSLGFDSSIPSRQNKSRVRIHSARFIVS